MKHSIKTLWRGDMSFETDVDGHKIVVDTVAENGGKDQGPSPKKMMLVAFSGCTGMDVVSILAKMRVPIKKCEITIEGELTDEHPKYYKNMHVIYEFTGKNLPMEKLQKAVTLSEENYCGVGALYRKAIPVTSEIRIVES